MRAVQPASRVRLEVCSGIWRRGEAGLSPYPARAPCALPVLFFGQPAHGNVASIGFARYNGCMSESDRHHAVSVRFFHRLARVLPDPLHSVRVLPAATPEAEAEARGATGGARRVRSLAPRRGLGLSVALASLLGACSFQTSGKMSSSSSFKAGKDNKLQLTPEPSTVDLGETVLLKGALKNVDTSALMVGFAGAAARVRVAEVRDGGLVVVVPEGARTGSVRVFEGSEEVWAGRLTVRGTTEGEAVESGTAVPAATPAAQPTTTSVTVTRVEPNPAPAGAQVTLHGRFSEVTAERVTVRVSGVSQDLPLVELAADRIVIALPPAATTGPVLVNVDGYAVWRGTLTIN